MKIIDPKQSEFSQAEYQQALLSLIPVLNRFGSKKGGEGIVYFVDDNFVVKRYTIDISSFDAFDKYCKEVSKFASRGYSLPKIYAWTSYIDKNTGDENFYLLEEKINGKELYHDSILFKTYRLCKDFCSIDEFNRAINLKSGPLFEKILITYMNRFIETNNQLAELDDAEIEKFILSDYNIIKEQRYSLNDVKADNVIFDGKKLTMIDVAYEETPIELTEEESKITVFQDIMTLFIENKRAYNYIKYNAGAISSVLKLKDENMKASASAFGKFVRKTNKLLSPVFTDKWDYTEFKSFLQSSFCEEDAKKIIDEIQKDF